jgi:outer membrane receptor protein involved in Fe transport
MIVALALAMAPPVAADIVIVRAERLKAPETSITGLSGEILRAGEGVRLDEALRVVPGVGLFRRTPSGAANATIQGLSLRPIAPNGAGRALVSLDNVPQNDPFGGWINWGRYNPLFLQQVEVRRGGAGAGFGPMALTGTLDLTEARGQAAGLSASYGSLNDLSIAARGSIGSDGARFTAMGAFQTSDGGYGISRNQRGPVDEPIDFQSAAVTLVTDIARDNGAWSFRGSAFSESKGAGLVGGQSSAQGLDVSAARRIQNDLGQIRFLLYAQGRDFTNQTVALAAGRISATPAVDQFATPASALGGSFAFVPSDGRNLPSIAFDWRRAEGQTNELFRFISRDLTRLRNAGGVQDLVGLSVTLPQPLAIAGGQLELNALVRADHWSHTQGIRRELDRTNGATTLSERIADKSGFVQTGFVSLGQTRGPAKISLYRTFRPPTLNELHRPFRIGNDVTEANTTLVPETLLGMDFDFRIQRPLGGGTLASNVTLYLNRLDNPIANVTVATGPGVLPRVGFLPAGGTLRERKNVGRIDARGIEASLSWNGLANGPGFYLAASWTQARVDGGALLPQLTGNRPAQAPNWSALARTSLALTDKVSANITVRCESARFEDDLNSRQLPAYGAVDLGLNWKIAPRAQIFLSGENILDTPIPTARLGDNIVSLTQGRIVRIGINIGR